MDARSKNGGNSVERFEVLPRLTGIAGFEWGTGFAINPVPPEQAAEYLRGIDVTGALI